MPNSKIRLTKGFLPKTLIYVMTGAVIGMIICVMFIGWVVIGSRPITWTWTKNFLRVGGLWGGFTGIMMVTIPWLREQKLTVRIVIGAIIGALPAIVMFSDLTELHDRLGMISGVLGGIICSVIIPILKPPLQPPLKRHLKQISSLNGSIIGGTLGCIIAMIGGIVLIISQRIGLRQIIIVYLLPMIMASIGAIYGYIKPITNALAQQIDRESVEGFIFGLMAIVYLNIMFVPQNQSINDLFANCILTTLVLGIPTMILGGIVGWVGQLITHVFIEQ